MATGYAISRSLLGRVGDQWGHITSEQIIPALDREDVVGISEVVSFYVTFDDPNLLKSIAATRARRKTLSGHAPDTKGPLWNLFAATGIRNDHESP